MYKNQKKTNTKIKINAENQNRKDSIKTFKQKYKNVNNIFKKYRIFQKRLQFTKIFDDLQTEYWKWYIYEIETVISNLKTQEQEVLKEHFVNKKQKQDMFFSKTKYYMWMNLACNNFLNNLDITFFDIWNKFEKNFYV